MPIYEYVCPTCGTFEEMQKFSDPVLTVCPQGHGGVERKISASGFILKGSGWYITDYARKGNSGGSVSNGAGKSDAASGEAKPSGESKPSSEAKAGSESKPAAAGSGA
ncbi:MAG TPA: zinc ribbon domain-containing protein [Thermodesulfobacteriota bacterium]